MPVAAWPTKAAWLAQLVLAATQHAAAMVLTVTKALVMHRA
jgi:hypothetical protein